MAPRGRPRTVGNTRMHAAVDALTPMGFSPNLIRSNVNYLLQEVYGGAEGWPFIEAESYRVLIERILEVQEMDKCEPVPELPSLPPPQTQIIPTEDSASHPEHQEQIPTALEACELPSLLPAPHRTPNIPIQDPSFPENPTENPIQDVQLQISSAIDAYKLPSPPPPQTENIPTRNASLSENPSGNRMQEMEAQIAELLVACENSGPPGFEQERKCATSKPKRRPCLGWIGPKDDNDFVLLQPMPVEGQEERLRARGGVNRDGMRSPDCVV